MRHRSARALLVAAGVVVLAAPAVTTSAAAAVLPAHAVHRAPVAIGGRQAGAATAVNAEVSSPPAAVGTPPWTAQARPSWQRLARPAAGKSSGKISGTVTDALTGAGVERVHVVAFVQPYTYVADTYVSSSTGSYTLVGLPARPKGYTVCFDARYIPTTEPFGLVSQCYQGVVWNGQDAPSGTTPVPVAGGLPTTGIDAALNPAGSISGTITDVAGNGLDAGILLFDASGKFLNYNFNSTGAYRIDGLIPGSYIVCFAGDVVDNGTSPAGYRSQCYKSVTWNTFYRTVPADGTRSVSVTAGQRTPNINAKLAAAGGFSVKVTATSSGKPAYVVADLYDNNGNLLFSRTSAKGRYSFTGLRPSTTGYFLCFDTSSYPSPGYVSECYHGAFYDGHKIPSNGTAVPIAAGELRTIHVGLADGGSISGTVTSAVDGSAFIDADVTAFATGSDGIDDFAHGGTDDKGKYTLGHLPASTTGYTVCFDASHLRGHDYADQCYNNVYWDGDGLPTGTTPVPVTADAVTGGIDAVIRPAKGNGSSRQP